MAMGKRKVRTMLVVDDDRQLLNAVERQLRNLCVVETALDHDEAIDIARSRRIDFALVDLFMPGVSGVQVIRDLAAIHRNVITVLMSAENSVSATAEAMRSGAFDSIPKKPGRFDVRALFAKLETELAKRLAGVKTLTRMQIDYVEGTVDLCEGNVTAAAERLGVPRARVHRLLETMKPPR
jgi:two-component system response regulator RegA